MLPRSTTEGVGTGRDDTSVGSGCASRAVRGQGGDSGRAGRNACVPDVPVAAGEAAVLGGGKAGGALLLINR